MARFSLKWCLIAVNGCLPIAISLAVLLAGCVQPVDNSGGKKPDGRTVHPPSGSLEQIAYESFQRRDIIRAEKLRSLKGVKYDSKRQEEIERAGAEASRETWAPVADALAKRLDSIPQDDQAAFDAVVEELAKGAERAGK